jgi:hypothetical protein
VSVKNGQDVVPYCTCTYNHLAGQLQTRAAAQHLLNALKPYLKTGDVSKLPKLVRKAIAACISKLPPLDPVTGRVVVRKLPGFQHAASPAPSQPTLTTTSPAAPTPPAPAPGASTPVAPTPVAPAAADPGQAQVTHVWLQPRSSAVAPALPAIGHRLNVVAQALGYTLRWAARHDRTGAYPYGHDVQRRLYRRLRAALKFA